MTEVSRTLVQPVRKTIRTGELSRARVDAVTQQVKIVEEREDGKLVERIEAHGPPDYEVIRAGGEVVGTHTDSGHADQALEVLELEAQAKIDLPLEENTERSTLGKKIKIKK